MHINHLHHVSLIVRDTAIALQFYQGILELPLLERPELGFPGAWLQLGGQQLHLLELANPDPAEGRPAHGGRDRHIAVGLVGLETLKARLERAGIDYTLSRSGRQALFCRDPDGNGWEFIEE